MVASIRSVALVVMTIAPSLAFARAPYAPPTGAIAPVVAHLHTPNCNHATLPAAPPAGVASRNGRYELRPVKRWVPAHYTKVWVPEQCVYKGNGRAKRCTAGYYKRTYVPGRYETVQQWVWVPQPAPRYHAPQHPASAPGVRIGVNATPAGTSVTINATAIARR